MSFKELREMGNVEHSPFQNHQLPSWWHCVALPTMENYHKNYKNFLILNNLNNSVNQFQHSPIYTSHTTNKILDGRKARRESPSVELGYSAGFTNCELTCIKHPLGIPANAEYPVKENRRHKPKQPISSGISIMLCLCGNSDDKLGCLHNSILVQADADKSERIKPKRTRQQITPFSYERSLWGKTIKEATLNPHRHESMSVC